jgi:hypothetical protein
MAITIFRIYRNDNGRSYIGYTRQPLDQRLKTLKYVSANSYRPMAIRIDIHASGFDSFTVETLATNVKVKDLSYLLHEAYEKYDSLYPSGYNLGDESKANLLNQQYLKAKHPKIISDIIGRVLAGTGRLTVGTRWRDPSSVSVDEKKSDELIQGLTWPSLFRLSNIKNHFPHIMQDSQCINLSRLLRYLKSKWHLNPIYAGSITFFKTSDLVEVEDALSKGLDYVSGRDFSDLDDLL